MLTRIIDVSARNPFLVLLLTAAASVGGWWSMRHVPLDAIPDLGDTQVIIYSRWERSPDLIEDQVTYPIVSAMLGAPRVKTVRGLSDFGVSFVYVIFDEGTDIYWARARTLEYLSAVLPRLPENVTTELGPDANGLGWVFQYALVDRSGTRTLADLRSVQDWYLRYQLKAVAGVSDVASLGGHVRQYQVEVDPNRLRAYGLSIPAVVDAVRSGNSDTGGRLIEFGGTEYMVRGRGYAQSVQDFESIVLTTTGQGAPVRVKDVGQVSLGPDLRRGVADLDGDGEVVSGVVIMRQGENAMAVIDRVKKKLAEVAGGLPPGVTVVPVYDRSVLIERSIATLETTLLEIGITVSVVILLFLWHVPSAIIPVIVIPVTVLVSFIPFGYLGISANIMSLGGIAIAIGALVDASIVIVEQTHKKLEIWNRHGRPGDSREVILAAIKEVAAPSFFALLVIAVAFLPVLTLEAEEGRLFRPLAYTKTLGMIVAALLAITLDPALRLLLTRVLRFDFRPAWLCGAANALLVGTVHPEERHPISRWLMRVYRPAAIWSLDHKGFVLGGAVALVLTTVPVYQRLGSEFMPPLDEEVLFYMPSTGPGISIAEAGRLLRLTDRAIRQFPEVARVLGKAGRAETPTDSAPLSMFESIITLRPRSEWRVVDTWYSGWAPEWLKVVLRRITSDRLSQEELVRQLNEAVTLPGLSNAWTMPIRGRTAMLTTGIRTPVGLKIAGSDPATIEELGTRIERILASVPGTRSVFAERVSVGHFLDVRWKREELARYGISLDAAQSVVEHAIGGENVSTTIEGRERYPVNVRYQADFRTDLDAIGRITVADAGGRRRVPVAELAEVATTTGPAMIRNEDGLLTGYVLIDLADRDPGGYVAAAREVLAAGLTLPPGYVVSWSGQYEAMARVTERLRVVVPITLFAVLVLLYLNTRSWIKTWLILLAMPFSAVGAIWLLYLLGYNMSVGVWVGLIALVGVDAGTGVFMLLYLDLAYADAKAAGRLRNPQDLRDAILAGAVSRLRPKFMTAATMMIGMMPIMWSAGTGSDVMKRIAAPMIGGIITSFLLELMIYPPLYEIWKRKELGGPPGKAAL